jgi:hypothetical protein
MKGGATDMNVTTKIAATGVGKIEARDACPGSAGGQLSRLTLQKAHSS